MTSARALVVASLSVGLLAVPRVASADPPTVTISAPAPGERVGGVVEVVADASPGVVSVAFDRSVDGGTTWSPISTDTDAADGWTASWDTAGLDGPAALRATASDGTDTAQATVEVTVDNTAPAATVAVSPTPFSPNGDGVKDQTTFTVDLDEDAFLSVVLEDGTGQVVRVFDDGAAAGTGTHDYVWNGYVNPDSTWERAPDGDYLIRVTAVDAVGNRAEETAPVTVDTAAPSLRWKRISPDPQTTTGRIRFRFRLADAAGGRQRLALKVFDQVGLVRTVKGISRIPGSRAVRWLPRYRGGGALIPGPYAAKVVARDPAGNKTVSDPRTFRIHRGVRTSVYRSVPGAGRRAALTFDDCASGDAWTAILNVLRRRGVKATFFCTGGNVYRSAAQARRTVAEGHAVGSHGYDHAYLPGLSDAAIRSEVVKDQNAWWKVAGTTPAPYFRPPYGAYNGTVLSAVGAVGFLRTMIWDVDPQDWRRPGSSVIASRVISHTHGGSVVLMHVLSQTAAALDAIITGLERKGLKLVTLPRLFRAAGLH